MCLQLALQMQHSDYSNLNQTGDDKTFQCCSHLCSPAHYLTSQQPGWSSSCFVYTYFSFRAIIFFFEYFLFWCVFTIPPRLFLKLSAWAKFSQLLLQTYYQFSSPICSILPFPSFSQKLRKTIFFKHWLYNKIILSQLYTIKGQFSFLLEAIWF